MTYAFNALGVVDNVGRFSLADGLHRAFRLAGTTADALIRDHVSHSIFLLNIYWAMLIDR